ncbi:MAG: hypothetical protein JNK56_00760, partial [Myxococcales bacterium]|nr:hypothetical protein [Myxococcales bacterium]
MAGGFTAGRLGGTLLLALRGGRGGRRGGGREQGLELGDAALGVGDHGGVGDLGLEGLEAGDRQGDLVGLLAEEDRLVAQPGVLGRVELVGAADLVGGLGEARGDALEDGGQKVVVGGAGGRLAALDHPREGGGGGLVHAPALQGLAEAAIVGGVEVGLVAGDRLLEVVLGLVLVARHAGDQRGQLALAADALRDLVGAAVQGQRGGGDVADLALGLGLGEGGGQLVGGQLRLAARRRRLLVGIDEGRGDRRRGGRCRAGLRLG